MKASKGFVNKAKSGAFALTARVRQSAAKGKVERPRVQAPRPKKARP